MSGWFVCLLSLLCQHMGIICPPDGDFFSPDPTAGGENACHLLLILGLGSGSS